jgi:stalled ribosome rescue protein Dom34
MTTHAVIWIDHKEARVFHVHTEAADEKTVFAPRHHLHRHPKHGGESKEHPVDAKKFFGEIAHSLADVDEVLLCGPANAKLEFSRYLHEHDRRIEAKIVGIESADHPTDGQIVAHARAYFRAREVR